MAAVDMETGDVTWNQDASENKSVTIRFINDTFVDNPDTTEITVYLENTDDRAVVYAGDEAQADNLKAVDVTSEEASGILATVGIEEDTHTVEADNAGLGNNASGTTVHVIAANQSGVDAFSQAEEKTFGSYDEGDFMKSHLLEIEGHTHAVFNEDAPTEDLADGYTYGEATTINGETPTRSTSTMTTTASPTSTS